MVVVGGLITKLFLTLCNPMDCITPGSPVHGICQARILDWLPCPPPGDLPNPGIEFKSPTLQVDSFPTEPPGKPHHIIYGTPQIEVL